jgi:Na+/H+ antiporter NhaA
MIDFVLSIFSTLLQMDMRDHHDIPFALPLLMACFVGGIIGFTLLRFIGNEQKEDRQAEKIN